MESSDYFNNFITKTGLAYPHTMPFADTFSFLTLGDDDRSNTFNTTGIYGWVDATDYHIGSKFDSFNHLTGYYEGGCGWKETISGLELFRAWRVPGTGGYMSKDFTFKELQVSPGRPSGRLGDENDDGVLYTGKYAPPLETPSSGLGAFSRVTREFTIPEGDYAVISYKLELTFDTGINPFSEFISLNEANTVHKQGPNDAFIAAPLWEGMTGTQRLLHAGIRVVLSSDMGGAAVNSEIYGDDEIPVGATVAFGQQGNPMEPSCPNGELTAWFSTDQTQFLKNPYFGGKTYTDAFLPWNTDKVAGLDKGATVHTASGHPEFFWNVYTMCLDAEKAEQQGGGGGGNVEWSPSGKNDLVTGHPRLDAYVPFRNVDALFPHHYDYLTDSKAEGASSAGLTWNNEVVTVDSHDTTVTQYNGDEGTANEGDYTKRTRMTTRVCSWVPKNSQQEPIAPYDYIQYRSLVFGWRNPKSEGDPPFPVFDSLIGAENGESLPTGSPLHEFDQGDFSFTGTTGYFPFQDGNNGMNITWALTWSAPCAGVAGCIDP